MCELNVCEINQLLILLNTLGYLERRRRRLELIESLLPDSKMVKLVFCLDRRDRQIFSIF